MVERFNRRVFARVDVDTRAYEPQHFESAFEERRWGYRALEGRGYMLAIPMYCSRIASMDVARAKIADFLEEVGGMEVRYLQRSHQKAERRSAFRSFRSEGGWLSAMPFVKRLPPEWRTVGAEWEIYSDRDISGENFSGVRSVYPQIVGTGAFGLARSPGPRVIIDPERRWLSWLVQGAILLLGLIVSLVAAATVFAPDVSLALRILCVAVLIVFSVAIGLWSTGNSDRWMVRIVGVLLAGSFVTAFGLLSRAVIEGADRVPWSAFLLAFLLMFSMRGLRHLVIIQPRTRVAGTVSVVALATGAAFAGTRAAIGAVSAEFGIPIERVVFPQWVTYVAGAGLFVYVATALLLIAAIWGWAEYNGMGAAFRKSRDILALMIVMTLLLYGTAATYLALVQGGQIYEDWLDELRMGVTPSATSDFAYRACLIEDAEEGAGASQIRTEVPMVIVESVEGPGWAWDPIGRNPRGETATIPIDRDLYDVVRVGDGVFVCPPPDIARTQSGG